MNNDELPLSAELASAYLDGELDATERAAAAADPEVMAAVESFTLVRTLMADAGPPVADSTKSAAIAAALAEFDAIHAAPSPLGATASTPAPVVSLQSRRVRVYRVLTGAAAAAIVGVVAIAALNTAGNNDADLSSATESPLPAATELPQIKIAAADTESVSAETDAPSDGGATAAAAAIPVIDSEEALQQFAADVEGADSTQIAAPAETSNAPAPNVDQTTAPSGYAADSCLTSDQVVLGPIIYLGTSALAVRVTSSGALQAIADTDCRVLVEI